ncbi:MAG: DUF6884 domain-containing protein [Bryobacteraceae bacterium]|jgi:hypothetical protein
MKTVFLVACAAKKRTAEIPAEDLYSSPLFRKSRAYVLRQLKNGDLWFILSAKHGLLEPGTVIHPYNETLNAMKKSERLEWSLKVMKALGGILQPGNRVVFLAGLRYREFLKPKVSAVGCDTLVPMQGMRIGEQLRWLS